MGSHRVVPVWNGLDFVRFWSKVAVGKEDECWIWTAYKGHRGYGQFSLGGRKTGRFIAHRIAWAMSHAMTNIPLHVLHTCDNPPCVNPRHLFLGDDAANVKDCIRKGRQCKGAAMSAALVGHMPRGRQHHNVKLTEDQVHLIRRLRDSGEKTRSALAKMFEIKISTVQAIDERRTWAWLK